MTTAAWFDVDKQGLAKLMAGRHKAFVLYELLQNAWDQNVTKVQVSLSEVPGRAESEIVVEDDDPDGFADLTHAYTLFAESRKKADPKKRPGERYYKTAYQNAIRIACEKAGVPVWHAHQLRHNAAEALEREYGYEVARIVLGHASLDATRIYAAGSLEKALAAVAMLG